MKDKTSTLIGEKLAEWTALAQRWYIDTDEITGWDFYYDDGFPVIQVDNYRPDINAGQAMELARKFGLIVNFEIGEVWKCGRTYPIVDDYSAICRAVVASVFGEEVDDDVS